MSHSKVIIFTAQVLCLFQIVLIYFFNIQKILRFFESKDKSDGSLTQTILKIFGIIIPHKNAWDKSDDDSD